MNRALLAFVFFFSIAARAEDEPCKDPVSPYRYDAIYSASTFMSGFWGSVVGRAYASTNLERLCERKAAFLMDAIAASAPLEKLVDEVVKSKPELVVLAEGHNERGRNVIYPALMKDLEQKLPKPFCLLLELKQVPTPDGRAYTGELSEIRRFIKEEGFRTDPIAEKWHTGLRPTKRDSTGYNQAAVDAEKAGIPVFFTDNPDLPGNYDDMTVEERGKVMNARDVYMAGQIKNLFSSGKCRSAMFVAGKVHFAASITGRTTMKDHLEKTRIKKVLVHTVDPEGESIKTDAEKRTWHWTGPRNKIVCGKTTPPPASSLFFSMSGDLRKNYGDVPLVPEEIGGGPGKWSDFDFTAVLHQH